MGEGELARHGRGGEQLLSMAMSIKSAQRRWVVLNFLMILMLAACEGVAPVAQSTTAPVRTTTTTAPTTTTASTGTTTESERCADATNDMIEIFDVLLERIDADPASFVGGSSATDDLLYELGGHIGEKCGQSGAGTAFSEILVYIADQATTRPAGAASIIEGFLDSLCSDPPVELTIRGRAACAGSE